MAIQGLIGTGDLGTNAPVGSYSEERPLNWRQGILMRYPNGHAPLTALTSVMKKKVTDDPQFHWWERELSDMRIALAESPIDEDPTSTWDVTSGDELLTKAGDILLVEESGELVRVDSIDTANHRLTVTRDWGGAVTTPNFTYDAVNINANLLIVGNVNEEGADTPESIRFRPSKQYNYTQIFRDSLKATRTAMQTRLRTVDEIRDAKQQCLLYHSIRMEYAFMHGKRVENTDGSEPQRSTGGIISFIPAANIIDEDGTALEMERFEELMLECFRWGSQEKVGFVGNRAIMAFVQMARRNASIEITPTQKEFGMDISARRTASTGSLPST